MASLICCGLLPCDVQRLMVSRRRLNPRGAAVRRLSLVYGEAPFAWLDDIAVRIARRSEHTAEMAHSLRNLRPS